MSTLSSDDIKPIARRSAKIACVVGPALTLVNQWEAVTALDAPDLTKAALTFAVPFCVSFFSGYAMRKSVANQMCANKALIATLRSEARASSDRAARAEAALLAHQGQPAVYGSTR